jgi:hypothetical protein
VLAVLERERIQPAPEADRFALMRRLHLDLTGLPPTPEEADVFVQDKRPDAYERLVGGCSRPRILASAGDGTGWTSHVTRTVRATKSIASVLVSRLGGFPREQPASLRSGPREAHLSLSGTRLPADGCSGQSG